MTIGAGYAFSMYLVCCFRGVCGRLRCQGVGGLGGVKWFLCVGGVLLCVCVGGV